MEVLHIRDVLAAVDVRQPDLIARFGGHAAAAGLSLLPTHLPAFQSAFDAEVRRQLRREDINGNLWSDGELESADLSLDTPINCATPVLGVRVFPNRCSMASSMWFHTGS